MAYNPTNAPAHITDFDGLRKWMEEELRNLAQNYADDFQESGGNVSSVQAEVDAAEVAIAALDTRIDAVELELPLKIKTIVKQTFGAAGTYTPTTGMVFCIIECVGNGGGGGGVAGAANWTIVGGGGGGGSYARKLCTAADIGASQAVTFGATGTGGTAGANNGVAGGDVAVGTLCIGKGGAGGNGASTALAGLGGAGGVAGTGDLLVPGGRGQFGPQVNNSVTFLPGSSGGGSHFGEGGVAAVLPGTSSTPGAAASLYGGGGGGACAQNSASNVAGGAGALGVVFITEYCV